MKRFGMFLFASLFFLVGAVDAQTVYKSIAPNGSVVYSDHPPADGKIEKTFEFAPLPSSPVPDAPVSAVAAKAIAPTGGGVVLFSATWCGYCRQAKAYLAHHGIGYRNIDIDSPDGKATFAATGRGGIPLLVSGSKRIRGFSAVGYDGFFRN